jgi:hypothetical protein
MATCNRGVYLVFGYCTHRYRKVVVSYRIGDGKVSTEILLLTENCNFYNLHPTPQVLLCGLVDVCIMET